jgi:hypothetical protein
MNPQTASKIVEKIDDLIEEIEELQRQKYKLQELYDFGDFIETHNLIDLEIERLQCQLRKERDRLLKSKATDFTRDVEDIREEEGGKEDSPSSTKTFNI